MKLAPIAMFVFNRLDHTQRTLDALLENDLASESILYIYSDGPRKEEDFEKIKVLREYLHTIKGFKEIHIVEREKNMGLANSIITGVTEVLEKYPKVIVMEDDLVTSKAFLMYMNELLDKYEGEEKIFSVAGFNFPPKVMPIPEDYEYSIYFCPRPSSWGWGTWKSRWEKADWEVKDYEKLKKDKNIQKEFNKLGDDVSDMLISQMNGEIDSWAIRWCYTHFKNNAFCIYPTKSYIDNIGLDGSGRHCGKNEDFIQSYLNDETQYLLPVDIEENKELMERFRNVYKEDQFKKNFYKFVRGLKIYNLYKKYLKKKK